MLVEDLLYSMRSGAVQTPEAITAFVQGVTDGSISRPQAAAWLAYAFKRGLTDEETVSFTQAMTHSGHVMSWTDGPLLIDKHSTGGVGDKVSLVLAPVWMAMGYRVPMISGRGLGHTGGTLDKLEAIPGYRTDLTDEELQQSLDTVGGFISGQTGSLAPADRVLYALRNEICAVESIPFVVGSILSKKIAEGTQRLVLDVKVGSGSFNKTLEEGRTLAEALVRVAGLAHVDCMAMITAMDRPLGRTIGNANEVVESIETLQGGGPDDLRELTCVLSGEPDAAAKVLDDGSAFTCFERMVGAQGGSIAALHDTSLLLGSGTQTCEVTAAEAGVIQQVDAYRMGRAAFVLGAGRRRAADPVDFGVGLEVLVKPGDSVERGQPVVRVSHRDGHALDDCRRFVDDAIRIGDEALAMWPLVIETVRPS